MIFNAKYGTLDISDSTMEYIRFGYGKKVLIMLPGLGEALRSLKCTALPLAFLYRNFAKHFTVYVFSRIAEMPIGYSTKDMANDLHQALDILGIQKADLVGVSMGGMIAQHFSANFPECVNKLIIAVSAARPNPVLEESIAEWINCAENNDFKALMDCNVRRIYSAEYYRKNKWLIPIMSLLAKPKSYESFITQAIACRLHDSFNSLSRISSPCLVIGGEQDKTLSGEASNEIAQQIPGATLYMYPDLGHGLYDEAEDFNTRVLDFLLK